MRNILKHGPLHFHFSSHSNEFWKEIGEMVAYGFERCGYQVSREVDSPPVKSAGKELHVAVGGHEYFNTFLKDPALIKKTAPLMIALTGEQPGSQWFSANLSSLSLCHECWDITQSGADALNGRGLDARHIQLGYTPRLEDSADSSKQKDLDVFFMASLTHERARRIAEYGLERWNLKNHFQLAEIEYAKTAQDRTYLPNPERNALAARSKITLNYHGHLIPFFEWHRALVAMANRSLFITDPVRASSPLLHGIHYVSASSLLINHTVDFFLERDDMREAITASAHDFLTGQLRMEDCIKRFVGSEKTLNITCGNQPQEPFASIQRDLKSYLERMRRFQFPKDFGHSCVQSEAQPQKRINKQHIVSKREQMAQRLKQESLALPTAPAYDIEHFAGPHAKRPPKLAVSVVISLFNYEQTICKALDSLLFSMNDPSEIEVIVVDDCSSDDSAEAARQWLTKAPFSGAVIKKHHNTGFISSRNIGIREARGETIAILDADNAYLPDGIQRLYDKLKATNADACYGMIVCIDEEGQPCGLLSAQPWDVRRLLFCPYIDAMALFRKSTLVEIGLYDAQMFQHAWFGWEDYELWLRMADREADVEFVPNFVALYRSHSSSMINATNLFQQEIYQYLSDKYQRLANDKSHTNRLFGQAKQA